MSGFNETINIQDIYISHKINGAPFVEKITNLNNIDDFGIKLSISHTKNYATAVCLILLKK